MQQEPAQSGRVYMIEIENGCFKRPGGYWEYCYTTVGQDTLHEVKFHAVMFQTDEGEVPEIGDFIEGGILIKRTKPKVNPDWRKWKDKDLTGNP